MKEIDFLPEWYKEGRRRRVRMRQQCVALGLIFLAMIAYNTISAHRIACATAELEQFEDQRVYAETVTQRFDMLSRELGIYQAEAEALAQMDSRIEVAAVMAEISHLIGEHVVLSRVEFATESVALDPQTQNHSGSAVRAAGLAHNATKPVPMGDVKFHVLLAGVAADPGNVGELVCRLEESSYFRDVHSSGFRNGTIAVPTMRSQEPVSQGPKTPSNAQKETLKVSEFEITCYLANYDEIEKK